MRDDLEELTPEEYDEYFDNLTKKQQSARLRVAKERDTKKRRYVVRHIAVFIGHVWLWITSGILGYALILWGKQRP